VALVKLGFIIDHRVCIGCHACTVACKAENDVPLGDFRTWVKTVEHGEFPDVSRSFLIERCNHCENAPCVAICPVNALYKRDDGIVDFNTDQCIGCRACQAACPYDAIYMDSRQGHTVAKCNFCSHRIDAGSEPACVIVCPTEAIVFGDLDDPTSPISALRQNGAVQPRAELKTEPQLAYVGVNDVVLEADRTSERPSAIMTSPWNGSANGSAPAAETAEAHDVYNVSHQAPWHSLVAAYMGTKAIATGVLLLGALAIGSGYEPERETIALAAPAIALLFLTITSLFLVIDLERPERFLRIVLQPNWTSWLVRGAYLLLTFGALSTLWLVLEIAGAEDAARVVAWASVPVSLATAGYTAWLFWQAPGRELWRTRAFLPQLLAQTVVAGASVWAFVLAVSGAERELQEALVIALLGGLAVSALATAREFSRSGTTHLRRARSLALRGALAPAFWLGAVLAGHLAPAALAVAYVAADGPAALLVAAGVLALIGQTAQDEVWLRAGQAVSQS
jgi:Fe-S-cluster-containing dehydrogenase component/formate-dependent nitrite reductase membrane component NrfD